MEFGAQIHHNTEQEKKVSEIAFVEKFHISTIAKTFYGVYSCNYAKREILGCIYVWLVNIDFVGALLFYQQNEINTVGFHA